MLKTCDSENPDHILSQSKTRHDDHGTLAFVIITKMPLYYGNCSTLLKIQSKGNT